MTENERIEKGLWMTGWCLIGAAFLIFLAIKITGFPVQKYMIPCVFYSLTGLYCPGCGGTRAVDALFHGHFLRSFLYHPLVPYCAVVGGWFLISQTVERLTGHKKKIAMRYRDCYLWIALAIVIVQFVVKIAIQLATRTDFLQMIPR